LNHIISNTLNGLDVDKLDYLYRDSFYIGAGIPFDLDRIITNAQVIGGNICFPEKNSYDVLKVFRKRYDLHKQFYNHKTVICIELLIKQILDRLDTITGLSTFVTPTNDTSNVTVSGTYVGTNSSVYLPFVLINIL
jgi:HD superfamily phosphohydrolase